MRDKRIPERIERIGYIDPVKRLQEDSPKLVSSWLKGGESLTPVQRIGHGLMTLGYLAGGLFLGQGAVIEFQADSRFSFLLFAFPAALMLIIAGFGLRNILRFKKHP